jgi:hypothetical protein
VRKEREREEREREDNFVHNIITTTIERMHNRHLDHIVTTMKLLTISPVAAYSGNGACGKRSSI